MTTYHALQRTKERTGLNMKSSARFIENGLVRGKGAENFAAKEREYLQRKEVGGKRALIHNSYCLIISADGICITTYPVPGWFGKKKYDGKMEIRNPKKYLRLSDLCEKEDIFVPSAVA